MGLGLRTKLRTLRIIQFLRRKQTLWPDASCANGNKPRANGELEEHSITKDISPTGTDFLHTSAPDELTWQLTRSMRSCIRGSIDFFPPDLLFSVEAILTFNEVLTGQVTMKVALRTVDNKMLLQEKM